jgi:HSP20 family protein
MAHTVPAQADSEEHVMPRNDEIVRTPPPRHKAPALAGALIEPLSRLRNEVDRLFDDFPARWAPMHFARMASALPVPAVDMTETDKAFRLSVEVPGMSARDVKVEVDDNMILISGEKREERDESEKNYSYCERSYGAFERRLELPPGANPQDIKARMSNGVLQVTLGKSDQAKASKRQIAIEGS